MYQLVAAYAQRHGDLRIPHDYVTEEHVRLGSWLAHQRELYRKQALTPPACQPIGAAGDLLGAQPVQAAGISAGCPGLSSGDGRTGYPSGLYHGDGAAPWCLAGKPEETVSGGDTELPADSRIGGVGGPVGAAVTGPMGGDVLPGPCLLSGPRTSSHWGQLCHRGRTCIGTMDCPAAPEISQRCRGGGAHGTGTPKTQAGRDRNGMGPVLGTMVGEIPGGKDLLPGPMAI